MLANCYPFELSLRDEFMVNRHIVQSTFLSVELFKKYANILHVEYKRCHFYLNSSVIDNGL